MASERACPKCMKLLEPCRPFAWPEQDRQLEIRVDEYLPGCRTQTIPPEGKYGKPREVYWMPMWECTTPDCPKRGGIAQHLTLEATVTDPEAHTEPRRHDADNPTLAP